MLWPTCIFFTIFDTYLFTLFIEHLQDATNDTNEWVKKNAVRKKYSNASSALSPKHHGKLHNGIKSPSRDSRVSKSDRNRDKALVRHLELMHNFTSEAVKLLKKEEEENTTTEDEMRMDDSAKIFRDILTLHHKKAKPHF